MKDREQNKIEEVRQKLGEGETRDLIISNLSFGFWVNLFDRHYDSFWEGHLNKLFGEEIKRAKVHELMKEVRNFRNRIAHHNYLRDTDLPGMMLKTLELFRNEIRGFCRLR